MTGAPSAVALRMGYRGLHFEGRSRLELLCTLGDKGLGRRLPGDTGGAAAAAT